MWAQTMLNCVIELKWQLHSRTRVSFVVFICLGVVLNPAVWWFGWPERWGSGFLSVQDLIAVLVSANALMAGLTPHLLRRTASFCLLGFFGSVCAGYLLAVAVTPVLFLIMSFVQATQEDVVDIIFIPMLLVLGWVFGVIPYYAITLGLPCAATFFFLALGLFCTPVRNDEAS